ncbi:exonuclease SbcCD subunit D [Salinispira pacifica]|uniref:Nuclease SbcCD subunit D n=1 Tax=Salinispira pacifica TaxID=1307761 RepID=V5WJ12_9SPIO|nr:exonuclease SbcCD subunit D [Salinispira pacifica]AHC15519.1 Exonuclease SbcD [Salinispira pacifica]
MKILHTADWHLGKILHDHSLLEHQEAILKKILDLGSDGSYDAMIIAGDIYDRSIPPGEAMALMSRFLRDFRRRCATPVLIIAGNHDSRSRLAYLAELLEDKDIHIRSSDADIHVPVIIGNAHFWLIPFLDPDISPADEDGLNAHERPLQRAVERIQAVMDRSKLNIAVAHCFTTGGESSDSERVFVGGSGEVSAELFHMFDYTALGHLHRSQFPGPGIAYSGSPLKYSFSESDDAKCVLSADVEKAGVNISPIALTPPRDLRRLTGSLKDLLENPEFKDAENDYVEIELDYIPPGLNPLEHLRQRFPHLFSIRKALPSSMHSPGPGGEVPGDTADGLTGGESELRGRDIQSDFASFYSRLHPDSPEIPAGKLEIFHSELQALRNEKGDE